MAGYVGNVPVPQSVREDQSFTATAGQTTFNTLGYTDGTRIKVTLNGVLLEGGGVDYTATNGSDVVLTVAAAADDILRFETFNEVQLVGNTSTTPIFKTSATLKNDTEEDTDGGRESTLIFSGEQSGGEISTLAEIEASHDGTADDEKGDLIFRTNDGNDGTSPTERLRINSAGDMLFSSDDPSLTIANTTHEDTDGGRESTIVFQGEQSGGEVSTLAQIEAAHDGTGDDEKGDLIFRTNDGSDGASPTEAFRVTSQQRLGIGTGSPDYQLDLQGGATTNDRLRLLRGTDDTNQFMTLGYNHISTHRANVALASAQTGLSFKQVGSDGTRTNMVINSDGKVGIGDTTPLSQLEVKQPTAAGGLDTVLTVSTVANSYGDGPSIDMSVDWGGYIQTGRIAAPNVSGGGGYGGELRFFTNGQGSASSLTEGMRLNSGGGILEIFGNGDNARVTPQSDNAGYLGQNSHRWQAVYAVNGSIQTSDRNLKTEITDSALGLDFVKALRPVSYKWISGGKHFEYAEDDVTKSNPTITDVAGKRNHYGLIAQEVKEALGDTDFGGWVSEDVTDENATQSLRYDQFIAPLIKAVQELSAKNDALEARIEALETE